jgi:hypothetical protein
MHLGLETRDLGFKVTAESDLLVVFLAGNSETFRVLLRGALSAVSLQSDPIA